MSCAWDKTPQSGELDNTYSSAAVQKKFKDLKIKQAELAAAHPSDSRHSAIQPCAGLIAEGSSPPARCCSVPAARPGYVRRMARVLTSLQGKHTCFASCVGLQQGKPASAEWVGGHRAQQNMAAYAALLASRRLPAFLPVDLPARPCPALPGPAGLLAARRALQPRGQGNAAADVLQR